MTCPPVSPSTLLLLLLPLFSSATATGAKVKGGGEGGCDTQAASDCMKYSELFMAVPTLEEQYAECANAGRSVKCLEDLIDRCPSLSEDDEVLHSMIKRHVADFKTEAAIVCSSATTTVMTSWKTSVTVSSTLLSLLLCLRVIVVL